MTNPLAGAWSTLRPPPLLTVSQWADRHRMLDTVSSAEPGKWRTSRTPHQPAPLLLVQPSLEMAELYAEQRMAPMLRSTPELAERVGDPKQRDSGNKKLIKQFPGGFLRVVGANSPSSLAGMPARYIFGDEVLTSTPTSRGSSLVERLMLQTGWRRYWVPCPHCSHMQVLGWSGLQWPAGKPRSAEYHCEACGAGIVDSERTKTEMLEGGEWRPDKPELEDGRSYGYHLPTLYAPGGWSTVSWGALAEQYDACGDNPDKMRVFVNTVWAETFDESELAAVDADGLAARAEVYARPVPDGVRLLTAGVDVQQDRLEVEIVGWGDDEESWSIDYAAIPGDPTGPDVWAELDEYLARPRDGYRVLAACVDSGYLSQTVQDWCYARRGRRIMAIKGIGGAGRPVWPKKGSRGKAGAGWRLWLVGVDSAKDVLWRRWSIAEPGPGCV